MAEGKSRRREACKEEVQFKNPQQEKMGGVRRNLHLCNNISKDAEMSRAYFVMERGTTWNWGRPPPAVQEVS